MPENSGKQRLTKLECEVKYCPQAEVAELADALRSGRSEHTLVRVQIPPSAFSNPLCKYQRGLFVSGIHLALLPSINTCVEMRGAVI